MVKDIIILDYNNTDGFKAFKRDLATKKTLPVIKTFSPKKDHKVYITDNVDIPKTKFKEFIKTKNVRITSNVEEADVIVINDKFDFILNETNTCYYYKQSTESVLKKLDLSKFPELENYEHPFILSTYHANDKLGNSGEYFKVQIINDTERIEKILSKTLVSSIDIMKNIQADETVIDKEYFHQLNQMLQSSDTDNHVVAMEIMANSDYEKSYVYLSLLIHLNVDQIYESRTKRHVNFKGLLTYLKLAPGNLNINASTIIKNMHELNLLTKETLDILRDELLAVKINVNHKSIISYGSVELSCVEVQIDSPEIRAVNDNKPYKYKPIND
jgi:hypothetical protein